MIVFVRSASTKFDWSFSNWNFFFHIRVYTR